MSSYTLTQRAADALDKSSVPLRAQVSFYKNLFASDSRVELDVTDYVIDHGRIISKSTLMGNREWEVPSYSLRLKNPDNLFSPLSADSWFQASPAVNIRDVSVVVGVYVDIGTPGTTPELAMSFVGRIDDHEFNDDEDGIVMDFDVIMEQGTGLRRVLTFGSGGRVVRPSNTW